MIRFKKLQETDITVIYEVDDIYVSVIEVQKSNGTVKVLKDNEAGTRVEYLEHIIKKRLMPLEFPNTYTYATH